MAEPNVIESDPVLQRRPPQFGLSTLLVLVFCLAVALSVLFAVRNNFIAGLLLLFSTFALPAVLTVLVIHDRSYRRTFCVGALFPTGGALGATVILLGMMLFETMPYARQLSLDMIQATSVFGERCRAFVGASWLAGVLVGVICVGARAAAARASRRLAHSRPDPPWTRATSSLAPATRTS